MEQLWHAIAGRRLSADGKYDRITDRTKEDAQLTGNGWLAGPYASLEIGKGVFRDTGLLYGGSANDIGTAFRASRNHPCHRVFIVDYSGRSR